MKIKNRFLIYTAFIFALALSSNNAFSQQFQKSYKDWSVYTTKRDGLNLCYMVSYPKRKNGNYNKRGQPYVMITNINGQISEVSATGGYPYKNNTEPRVIIDGEEHRLSMTKNETAWFKTDEYDAIVIGKMKKGHKMTVKGTSKRGTYSIDTYSLSGFTSAYKKISTLCN